MATTSNAFDLLKMADATKPSKKKKQTGKDVPQASESATGVNSASKTSKTWTSGPTDLAEAVAINERSAREAKSAISICERWQDWSQQVGEKSGKANKYKDVDGTLVDFRQVLLKSAALEISFENAVVVSLGPEHENALGHLLTLLASRLDPQFLTALAAAFVRLARLVKDESFEVKGVAQRAAYSLAAQVKARSGDAGEKAESAAPSWSSQVTALTQAISKEQGLLQRLAAAGRGGATKEHTEIARKIFSLTAEQFDMVQSGPVLASASELAVGGPALDELRSNVYSKLQAVLTDKPTKGGKHRDTANKQSALAALRKEETLVSQQCESVATQIRTLEAQLRSLHSQQAQLEEKRAQLQQRTRASQDSSTHDAKGPLAAAHYQEELDVVNSIFDVLSSMHPGSSHNEVMQAQLSPQSVSSDFAVVARQYLEIAKDAIAGIPSKIAFCKQRRTQAERLLKLGSKDGQQIHTEAEKLLAESIQAADDLMHTSIQVAGDVKARWDRVLRSQPDADSNVAALLPVCTHLLSDIQAQYDAIQAVLRPVVPVSAPAPAAAPAPAPVTTTSVPVANGRQPPVPTAFPAPAAALPRPGSAVTTVPQPMLVAALEPAPVQPCVIEPAAPPTAFDAAAAYLASARQIAPTVRSESPAVPAPRRNLSAASAKPSSASSNSSAARRWSKPAGPPMPVVSASMDSSLPTPAEASARGTSPPSGHPGVGLGRPDDAQKMTSKA